MKIYVCSKKDMRSQWYTNKDWYHDKNKYFITISGLADNLDWAYPFTGSHVLRLKFDDITEKYFEEYGESSDVLLFDKDDAKEIHKFVDSLQKDISLYVNCTAGISRSGAVGYQLNEYLNKNINMDDYIQFFKDNSQIQPNPTVKRILGDELFGIPDWGSIFGAKDENK